MSRSGLGWLGLGMQNDANVPRCDGVGNAVENSWVKGLLGTYGQQCGGVDYLVSLGTDTLFGTTGKWVRSADFTVL